MTSIRRIVQFTRADFLERVRRYSFLVTMVGALYLGYAVNAGYVVIKLGKYRGVYNSAWVGTLVAQSACLFITLIGFYVVKNSISRDRETRVGQILAATPLKNFLYLLGKAFSNFGVLVAIVLVQAVAAVVMQLLSRENPHLEFAALFLPFLFLTFPTTAFVAALAVFFESVRWLQGGFGNVFYFFLVQAFMVLSLEAKVPALDLWSLQDMETSMKTAVVGANPDYNGGFSFHAGPREPVERVKVFQWNGIEWTPELIGRRTAWYGYSLLVLLLATLFFNRFDETRVKERRGRSRWWKPGDIPGEEAQERRLSRLMRLTFSVLPRMLPSSRFGQLLAAEVRLMMKGVHWVWYTIALTLNVTSLALPLEIVKGYLLPIAWSWPVFLWSKMGMREAYYRTDQLLFSAPKVRESQLLAVWAAGVLLALTLGIGAGVHFMILGEWQTFFGFIAGVIFIPSLAVALGVWSGTGKLFEAVYLIWWYVGAMNHLPELDFTGVTSNPGITVTYFLLSFLCLALALAGRRRQLAV